MSFDIIKTFDGLSCIRFIAACRDEAFNRPINEPVSSPPTRNTPRKRAVRTIETNDCYIN